MNVDLARQVETLGDFVPIQSHNQGAGDITDNDIIDMSKSDTCNLAY